MPIILQKFRSFYSQAAQVCGFHDQPVPSEPDPYCGKLAVPDSDSYTKIDASSLDSGIYFLNIVSSNGNSVLKKVVVQ